MPPDSDIALQRGLVRRLGTSLRLVILMALAFIGLGAFLFFLIARAADERARDVLAVELEHSTATIADALRPVLRGAAPGDVALIAQAMAPYASSDRVLRLYFTPGNGGTDGVFFIAGAPVRAVAQGDDATTRMIAGGALGSFAASCTPTRIDATLGRRDGPLWSVVPVASTAGCWRLVANRTVAATGPSVLLIPPIRSTGIAAVAAALIMIVAVIVALTHVRRLRQLGDMSQGFAEITAVPDAALLPQPANDGVLPAEADAALGPANDATAEILDLKRGAVDVSAVVTAYAEAARAMLGADGTRLQLDIEPSILIDGREAFVRTILEDLIEPALRAPAGPIAISLHADDLEGRGSTLLMITVPPGTPGEEGAGRLSHIKQFIAALGATSAAEMRPDGGETVRLRFPLSRCYNRARSGAG